MVVVGGQDLMVRLHISLLIDFKICLRYRNAYDSVVHLPSGPGDLGQVVGTKHAGKREFIVLDTVIRSIEFNPFVVHYDNFITILFINDCVIRRIICPLILLTIFKYLCMV